MALKYKDYISDLVVLLLAATEEAEKLSQEELEDGFQSGRLMAYTEVLSLMQNQADAFQIPRHELGLEGFEQIKALVRSSGGPHRG